MLLDYYINDEYIDSLFPLFDRITHQGYYVKMALAWAISMCYVRFPAQTTLYLQNNRLVVEQGEDSPRLYSLGARVSHAHWVLHPVEPPFACQVRLRHRQPLQDVVLLPGKEEGEWLLRFAAPQRAVTPGQFAAFYRQGECLGGATIEEAFAQALTEE